MFMVLQLLVWGGVTAVAWYLFYRTLALLLTAD